MKEKDGSKKGKHTVRLSSVLHNIINSKESMENTVPLLKVFGEIFKSRIEESEFISDGIGERDERVKGILDSIRKSSESGLRGVNEGLSDIMKRVDDLNRIGKKAAVLIDEIKDIVPGIKSEILLKLEEIQNRLDEEFAEVSESREHEKMDDERVRKREEQERKRKLKQLEGERVRIERAIVRARRKAKPDEEAVKEIGNLREELKRTLRELASKLGEDSEFIIRLVRGFYSSSVDLANKRFEVYKEIIRKCLLDGKVVKELWEAYDELLLPLIDENYKLAKEQTEFLNRVIESVTRDEKVKFKTKDIPPEFNIGTLVGRIDKLDENFEPALFEKILYMGFQLLSVPGISLKKKELKHDIETLKGISVPHILDMQKKDNNVDIKNTKQILKKIAKAWQNDVGQFYTTEENLGRISLILEAAYKKNMEELLILRSDIKNGQAQAAERAETDNCLSMIDETNRRISEYMNSLKELSQHEKEVLSLAEKLQNSSGEETKNLFENLIAKRKEYEERISKVIENQLMRKGKEEAIIIRRVQIYECLLCSHLVPAGKLSETYKEYSPYFVLSEKNRKKLNKEVSGLLNKKLEECKCILVKLEVPKIPPELEERERREEEGRKKAEEDEEKAGKESGKQDEEEEIEAEVEETLHPEKEEEPAPGETGSAPEKAEGELLEELKNQPTPEKVQKQYEEYIKESIDFIAKYLQNALEEKDTPPIELEGIPSETEENQKINLKALQLESEGSIILYHLLINRAEEKIEEITEIIISLEEKRTALCPLECESNLEEIKKIVKNIKETPEHDQKIQHSIELYHTIKRTLEEELNKTTKETAHRDDKSERTKPFSRFDSELERLKKDSEKLKEEFKEEVENGIKNIKVSVLEGYIAKANNNISTLIVLGKEISRETDENITEEHYRRIAEINSDLCYVVAESLRTAASLEDTESITRIAEFSGVTVGLVEKLRDVFNIAGGSFSNEVQTELDRINNLIGRCYNKISRLNETHSAEGGKIDENLWKAFLGIKHGSMLIEVLKVPEAFSHGKNRIEKIRKESEDLRGKIEKYLGGILENLRKYAEGYAMPGERTDEVRIMETAASLTLKEMRRATKPEFDILEIIGEIFKLRADEFKTLKEDVSGIVEKENTHLAKQMSVLLKSISSFELDGRRWQVNVLQFRDRLSEAEKRVGKLCVEAGRIWEKLGRASDENDVENLKEQRKRIINSIAEYCEWYEKVARQYTSAYARALESQARKRISYYAEIVSYHELFAHRERVNSLESSWTAYSQFLHPIGEINWIVAFKSGEKLKELVRKLTDGRYTLRLDGFSIPMDFRERAGKLLDDPRINKERSFELFEEWLRKRRK